MYLISGTSVAKTSLFKKARLSSQIFMKKILFKAKKVIPKNVSGYRLKKLKTTIIQFGWIQMV
jgi:hypothetical protein